MLTYKTKLLFDSEKAYAFWVERMCLVRDCYNYASQIVFEEKIPLGLKPFHSRLYRAERDMFPSLPAQMCIKVNQQLLANYRTAKTSGVKLEKPMTMKRPSVMLDKRLYSRMTRESFSLTTGDKHRTEIKFVRYPKFDELASKYRMCQDG